MLKDIYQALRFFRDEFGNSIPLQQVEILLILHHYNGISISELGHMLDLNPTSASKNVAALSEYDIYKNKDGFDLVSLAFDPRNPRGKTVSLNSKGKNLMKQLTRILEK